METIKEETQKKKTIIIALPGDNFSSKFIVAWTNTLSYLLNLNKYNIVIAPATGSYVTFVRMRTLGLDVRRGITQKPFDGETFDVWITIDSDIIFSPEAMISLIESTEKHPVVSGMYRMADLVNFAAVKNWDTDYFSKNGTFEFLTEEAIQTWKKETNLRYMPVHYTGLGFFACRKEVLDKLTYPYFDGNLQEIIKEDGTVLRDLSSEDVCFCKNILAAGYEIVLDTDLRLGHLKPLLI
jgi:hypothetical protein